MIRMVKVYQCSPGLWKQEDSNHMGSYFVLAANDYYESNNQMIKRNLKLTDTIASKDNEIEQLRLSMKKLEQKTKEQIEKLDSELDQTRDQVIEQKVLNETLLRISRERANADRKLKPKKDHSGYIIFYSQEKEIHYRYHNNTLTTTVWETLLQCPYTVDFTVKQVRNQFYDDLLSDNNNWNLANIGIEDYYILEFSKLWDKFKDNWNINRVYHDKFRANYQTGFWECTITHTLPLKDIPKDMRP